MSPLILAFVLAQTLPPIEGTIPQDAEFVALPFEVPAGTAELHITHETLESGAIIDWGVEGPDGFRGYGGGNSEPITIGARSSSPVR